MINFKKENFYRKVLVGLLSTCILLTGCGTKTKEIPSTKVESKEAVKSENKVSETIEKKAEHLLSESEAFSVQYAIIDNGKILSSGVKGKSEDGLNKDTTYGIGSVSKVFTAVAVIRLVEDGKVDLDTPVYKYIPEFTMKDERYKEITPRMLLDHSSGLRGTEMVNDILLDDNDSYVHDKLLEVLKDQTLKADPGEFSVYCNTGFSLAEILVERVGGLSFTEFLSKNVLDPLQMKNSGTPQSSLDRSKFARFYMEDGSILPRLEYCNTIGSGGVISTAEDMLKFSEIFMDKNNSVISNKSAKDMYNEQYKQSFGPIDYGKLDKYGLGWDSTKLYPFSEYGIKGLAKGGDIFTYHAALVVLPEENMSAVVLTSGGDSGNNQALASEMLMLGLKDKGKIKEEKENKTFEKPVPAKITEEVLKYGGVYILSNERFEVEITKDGKLSLSNEPDKVYIHVGDGKFVIEDGSSQIQFVDEKNKKTYLWQESYTNSDEFPQMFDSQYIGEKIIKNEIPTKVAKAWKDREGDIYYMLNQKYSAAAYISGLPAADIEEVDEEIGYWMDKKIINENIAVSEVQIPGIAGRDTVEVKFYKENGNEYLKGNELIAINGKSLKPLEIKNKIQIGKDGYAVWHKIPKELANKTLTVKMPKNAAYTIYNSEGNCINSSYISDENTTVLPEGGTIVFAGDIGSQFELSIK
ncbi:serine hydrolase domain-containing protein [Tissierella praeacuta]|uniref:serine hydrolase domain-containing protein n=1 Tax=Tissierella praeacuta TaxID=43131 RepID=UPI00333EB788